MIIAGTKVELRPAEPEPEEASGDRGRIYISRVYAVLTEDTFEAAMPVENGQPVLLSVDREYDLVFCGKEVSYQCFARITDRYRRDNEYMMTMELTSNLRRYQRREYYRFDCALETLVRSLDQEEVQAVEDKLPFALTRGRPMERCMVVDVSSDELCFSSSQYYEPESLLYLCYDLPGEQGIRKYEMIGRVAEAPAVGDSKGEYRHRIVFFDADTETKEDLVWYIFEEERKSRKKRGQ